MYEFGKSAMEYVVDSMNSVGNVLMLHKIPESMLTVPVRSHPDLSSKNIHKLLISSQLKT